MVFSAPRTRRRLVSIKVEFRWNEEGVHITRFANPVESLDVVLAVFVYMPSDLDADQYRANRLIEADVSRGAGECRNRLARDFGHWSAVDRRVAQSFQAA
jgi:hypothetical protein